MPASGAETAAAASAMRPSVSSRPRTCMTSKMLGDGTEFCSFLSSKRADFTFEGFRQPLGALKPLRQLGEQLARFGGQQLCRLFIGLDWSRRDQETSIRS